MWCSVFHTRTMTDGSARSVFCYVYSPVSDVICQLSVNSRGKRKRDIINIDDKPPSVF